MSDLYQIYSFDVEITLRRKEGRYDSTNLVHFDIKQEMPLRDDVDARRTLRDVVDEALDKAEDIVTARIDFDNTVRQIESGDVIDTDLP